MFNYFNFNQDNVFTVHHARAIYDNITYLYNKLGVLFNVAKKQGITDIYNVITPKINIDASIYTDLYFVIDTVFTGTLTLEFYSIYGSLLLSFDWAVTSGTIDTYNIYLANYVALNGSVYVKFTSSTLTSIKVNSIGLVQFRNIESTSPNLIEVASISPFRAVTNAFRNLFTKKRWLGGVLYSDSTWGVKTTAQTTCYVNTNNISYDSSGGYYTKVNLDTYFYDLLKSVDLKFSTMGSGFGTVTDEFVISTTQSSNDYHVSLTNDNIKVTEKPEYLYNQMYEANNDPTAGYLSGVFVTGYGAGEDHKLSAISSPYALNKTAVNDLLNNLNYGVKNKWYQNILSANDYNTNSLVAGTKYTILTGAIFTKEKTGTSKHNHIKLGANLLVSASGSGNAYVNITLNGSTQSSTLTLSGSGTEVIEFLPVDFDLSSVTSEALQVKVEIKTDVDTTLYNVNITES